MEQVQPWILKAFKQSVIQNNNGTDPSALLPLEPFRTRKVQLIKFLAKHEWGSGQSLWAEASDRDVTIFVHISVDTIRQFESDQKADRRSLHELGYPTFQLGCCRWIWGDPFGVNGKNPSRPNYQLCLRISPNFLPKKPFRLGCTPSCPFTKAPTATSWKKSSHLLNINYALAGNPDWIQLKKKLDSTIDPRICLPASDDVPRGNISSEAGMNSGGQVITKIRHPGVDSKNLNPNPQKSRAASEAVVRLAPTDGSRSASVGYSIAPPTRKVSPIPVRKCSSSTNTRTDSLSMFGLNCEDTINKKLTNEIEPYNKISGGNFTVDKFHPKPASTKLIRTKSAPGKMPLISEDFCANANQGYIDENSISEACEQQKEPSESASSKSTRTSIQSGSSLKRSATFLKTNSTEENQTDHSGPKASACEPPCSNDYHKESQLNNEDFALTKSPKTVIEIDDDSPRQRSNIPHTVQIQSQNEEISIDKFLVFLPRLSDDQKNQSSRYAIKIKGKRLRNYSKVLERRKRILSKNL